MALAFSMQAEISTTKLFLNFALKFLYKEIK